MVHIGTVHGVRHLSPSGVADGALFDGLDGSSRIVLLVAVLAEECDQWALVGATSAVLGVQFDLDVLDPVVARGLVVVDAGKVRIRSDHVRRAVAERALPSERQRVHRALADLFHNDPVGAAWHGTHATRMPSSQAAELAVTTARSLHRARQPARAYEMLEQAARLSPTPAIRAACEVEAGSVLFALGRPAEASALLGLAEMTGLDPDLEALTGLLRDTFVDPRPHGPDANPIDVTRATRTLDSWGLSALTFSILVAVGGRPLAHEIRGGAIPGVIAQRALVALGTGDLPEAARLLAHDCSHLAQAGLRGVETHARALLAQTSARIGDLGAAIDEALAARELASATQQPGWAIHAALTAATVAAMRGQSDGVPEVGEVDRIVLVGENPLRPLADLARAVAMLSADQPENAFPVLVRLTSQTTSCPELLTAGLLGYLADAAAHTHHAADTRSLVSRIAVVSPTCARGAEYADLLYATAILAPDASSEACFDALSSMQPAQWPWVRARADLARGAWLRRNRRVGPARHHLLSAQRLFAALDAPVWGRRVQTELRAAGVRAQTPEAPGTHVEVADKLSPQELAIVQLAAEGLSNRQIGDRLFLSPRTVGSHLYRVFPKLDVTSRHQLVRLV